MLCASVLLAMAAVAASTNLNGRYIVASGDRFAVPFNDDYASKGHEYFDVWTPEIATTYGQVFWQDMGVLALPPAIVERFAGKVIAITGYESDQVIVTPQGQPGVNPDQDFSVPYNWAYNHHYGVTLLSNASTLVRVSADPGDPMAHGADWKMMAVDIPEIKAHSIPNIPTSTVFSEGNGGEARKSFHGYPRGYAQILQSPATWRVTPMQIDTRNRACGVTPADIDRCPQFTPGPEPLQARFGLGIPPQGTNYSALIECPCNSRFGGDPAIYPGTKTKFVSHQFAAVAVGTCKPGQTVTNPVDCFNAVAVMGVNATTIVNQTVTNASLPTGCSVITMPDNTAVAYYNLAKSTEQCQLGNVRSGQVTTAVGVTLGLSIVPDPTVVNFTRYPAGVYCSANKAGIFKSFVPPTNSTADALAAVAACEAFCAQEAGCWGCSVDQINAPTNLCRWNAIPACGTVTPWGGKVPGDITQKVIGGDVTITMSGPANAWFGVGFNALWMHDQPWTIIVNSTSVTERKIGTCGDEGEHCPGDQIETSVKVVSTQVVGNVRTVVMTRSTVGLTSDHYSFNEISQSTINIISAIGSSQALAYHAAHAIDTITMTTDGEPTCVCDVAAVGKLCDVNGNNCMQFVKDCVPAPNGDLLTQNNPTCSSMNYVGGLTGCCANGRTMLDADQDPGTDLLRYHLKFRFWFQEYTMATPTTNASHFDLPRIYYQTESNAGEYDIPPAFAIPGKPLIGYPNWPENLPTPGTTCTGTCPDGPDCECIHTIAYNFESSGFRLIYAGGHCHAPACHSMILYRNDTGEVLCQQLPVWGAGNYSVNKFDDPGYITLPPCLWGDADEGLNPSEFLPAGTPLYSYKRVYNKRAGQPPQGHYGDMASWQMRGVFF